MENGDRRLLTLTERKKMRRCLESVENQMQRIVVQTIDEDDIVHFQPQSFST